jgi:hypothetical protein
MPTALRHAPRPLPFFQKTPALFSKFANVYTAHFIGIETGKKQNQNLHICSAYEAVSKVGV